MNEYPFLFDDLADDLADPLEDDSGDEAIPETPAPVYTSPIEQATFDIMELVDSCFRAAITVEEYDAVQKKVKKILTEAFDEKTKDARPASRNGRALLVVRDDP